jgi:hypothetical protein
MSWTSRDILAAVSFFPVSLPSIQGSNFLRRSRVRMSGATMLLVF